MAEKAWPYIHPVLLSCNARFKTCQGNVNSRSTRSYRAWLFGAVKVPRVIVGVAQDVVESRVVQPILPTTTCPIRSWTTGSMCTIATILGWWWVPGRPRASQQV
jgi:hypothetical protein